jgi:hypothetical protein
MLRFVVCCLKKKKVKSRDGARCGTNKSENKKGRSSPYIHFLRACLVPRRPAEL